MKKLLLVFMSVIFFTSILIGNGSNLMLAYADDNGWTDVNKDVTVADVNYMVNKIKFSNGSEFLEAEDGKDYLFIDMTVKNNTDEEVPLSSLLTFDLKDSNGQTYDISLLGLASLEDENLDSIDGNVAAKSEKRGALAYEIPENLTGLTLVIKDIIEDTDTSIQLN